MLKIGEFSQLSQVTIKTLHHYDEIGLFKPADTDPASGYRYYTLEQLPRIHSIMALKEMDLTLEQISVLLVEDLSIEQLRAILNLKKAELMHAIKEEHRRITLIENRLLMLETENDIPQLDIVLKKLEPLRVLSLRLSRMHSIATVVPEMKKGIESGRIHFAGQYMDVLYGGEIDPVEPFDSLNFHHEILLTVSDSQKEDVQLGTQGWLYLREEPEIETAATLILHCKDRGERLQTIMHIQRWAVRNGYRLKGVLRLLNHRGPFETINRLEWITEVQLAVQREVTNEVD